MSRLWSRVKSYLGSSRFLNLVLILALVLEVGLLLPTMFFLSQTNFLAAVLPGVLAELANENRKEVKLVPLRYNPLLSKAAQLKAEDMARNGYFSHSAPDGKKPWYWLERVGYDYIYAGENLALNFSDSSEVNKAWMNSPTHRDNILKKEFREIGLGVAEGVFNGQKGLVVVEFFATPASALGEGELVPLESPGSFGGAGLARFAGASSLGVYLNRYLSSPTTVVNSVLFVLLVLVIVSLFFNLVKGRKEKAGYWWKAFLVLMLLLGLVWFNKFLSSRNLKIADSSLVHYNISRLLV